MSVPAETGRAEREGTDGVGQGCAAPGPFARPWPRRRRRRGATVNVRRLARRSRVTRRGGSGQAHRRHGGGTLWRCGGGRPAGRRRMWSTDRRRGTLVAGCDSGLGDGALREDRMRRGAAASSAAPAARKRQHVRGSRAGGGRPARLVLGPGPADPHVRLSESSAWRAGVGPAAQRFESRLGRPAWPPLEYESGPG